VGRMALLTQSAVERSASSGTPELIGLGAIGSAEDTPPSSASLPAEFFYLLAEVLGFGALLSLLETSTSMRACRYNPKVCKQKKFISNRVKEEQRRH
jgi:hypothetical protein